MLMLYIQRWDYRKSFHLNIWDNWRSECKINLLGVISFIASIFPGISAGSFEYCLNAARFNLQLRVSEITERSQLSIFIYNPLILP